MPLMHLTRVDLPAPLSPTSAVTSPAWTGQVDVAQHLHGAEALVDPAQLQKRGSRHGVSFRFVADRAAAGPGAGRAAAPATARPGVTAGQLMPASVQIAAKSPVHSSSLVT